MPELPEVETLKRGLIPLVGKIIKSVKITWPKLVAPLLPEQFGRKMRGRDILAVSRRAKMIILELSGGNFLVVHLKMTGQLVFEPQPGKLILGGHPQKGGIENLPNKFTRATIIFTDGAKLYFNDQRKFGWLKLLSAADKEKLLANIGVEPLGNQFTLKKLTDILARYPKRKIKQILLDQTLIAGIGNIYADESCFSAKIKPTRLAGSLTTKEIKDLHQGIKKILQLSISKKGTSFSHYVNADAQPGGFVPYLKVYGRKNQKCWRCGGTIKQIKVNGRGTHYCENCQK
jgi:formamidopyrimidine-DNA glycosylase